MAMTPSSMANFIISSITDCSDPGEANNIFYKALCDYVETNAQVFYSWSATTPPPSSTPDPMKIIQATIKTSGSLSPSGEDNPALALSSFSNTINSNISTWLVQWPSGFELTQAFIIPNIMITASMATDMMSAWNSVCSQIIAGIKAATPTASGAHGSYIGIASFSEIN